MVQDIRKIRLQKQQHLLKVSFVLQAIERGENDGSDWHASKESLLQARADEQTIQEVLGEIYAKQQVLRSHRLAYLCGKDLLK